MLTHKAKALILALTILFSVPAWAQDGTFYSVRFVECYDGDTCTVVIPSLPPPFTISRIRLRDVDTPEIGRPKCEQERQLAIQARMATIRWLAEANAIDLLRVELGIFGRLEADILVDNVSVGALLLQSHLAVRSEGKRTQDWCLPFEQIFPDATPQTYGPREVS